MSWGVWGEAGRLEREVCEAALASWARAGFSARSEGAQCPGGSRPADGHLWGETTAPLARSRQESPSPRGGKAEGCRARWPSSGAGAGCLPDPQASSWAPSASPCSPAQRHRLCCPFKGA